jgi:hypothetical protein
MDLPDYLTDMDGEQGRQAEEEVGPRGAHDIAVRCQMGVVARSSRAALDSPHERASEESHLPRPQLGPV